MHYLRAALVKPLQLPGLEDLSLLGKNQIPHVTALALPDTWYSGFMDVEAKLHSLQNSDADKTSDKLTDTNDSRLLCAVSRPCEISPSAPSSQLSGACLAAAASAQTPAPLFCTKEFKSNLFASSSFKTNRTHHYSFSSKLPTGECPPTQWQPHDLLLLQFGTGESAKHISAVTQFPLVFPCSFCSLPHFSLTFLFWYTNGGKTHGNMLQSWNYSSLHGYEIKQKIDFPKKSSVDAEIIIFPAIFFFF